MTKLPSELCCEFYPTEDGEPWAGFVQGHHPLEVVESQYIRDRIMREADCTFGLDDEDRLEVEERMRQPAAHLWILPIGDVEDREMFSFCKAEDKGAIAITGWRLR